MIETPVSASPAMIARSTGAAPRQRGSSDGCTLKISYSLSSGSETITPYAQRASASGSAAAIRSSTSGACSASGWISSSPSERAVSATGGDCSALPRPLGRSGRVITSCGRCGLRASRSSTAAANGEVPR